MTVPPVIAARVLEAELMDDPALAAAAHLQALRGLSRINRLSRTVDVLWGRVRPLCERASTPLRILDVATGGGDLPIGLARRAQRAGAPLEVAGCDISRRAMAYARLRARRSGASIRFFVRDAFAGPLPAGYDVLTSSLFLHHLTETQVVALLRSMAAAATRLVLIDDLVRSPAGLLAAQLGTRILSRSPVVHVDGPRSVRAAFTPGELSALADEAGLRGHTVTPRFPWRQILEWRRDA